MGKLFDSNGPTLPFFFDTVQQYKILRDAPFAVYFRWVKMVHPSFSALFGISEESFAGADEQFPCD